MGKHTLNALTVKKIEATQGLEACVTGGGLWLVTKGAHRYWIWDHVFAGKRRQMGLGPLHTVGLAKAREGTEAARKLLRQGIDPIAQRDTEAAAEHPPPMSRLWQLRHRLRQCGREGQAWRGEKTECPLGATGGICGAKKNDGKWDDHVTNHAKAIRDKPIADIGVDDVLSVIEPLWGVKQETAEHVREQIARVLDAAKVAGLRTGDNPAKRKGNLEHSTLIRPSFRWARPSPGPTLRIGTSSSCNGFVPSIRS